MVDVLSTSERLERWQALQSRLGRVDERLDELSTDINRSLAISQAVNDKLDDIGLRVASIDTRVAHAREQREHWFEQLSRLTDDVLKNRALIRELQEIAPKEPRR